MKNMKLLIGMTLILTCHGVQAQDASFLKEGKRWNYVSTNGLFGSHIEFIVQGDTLIGGETYKKLYVATNEGTPTYYCAMREKDGKVYRVNKGTNVEQLLFNTEAETGDLVYTEKYDDSEMYLTVTKIDEIVVNGTPRKRLALTGTESFNNGADKYEYPIHTYIVEGIGSSIRFDFPEGFFRDGIGYYLVDCTEDNQVVFRDDDFYHSVQNVYGYTYSTIGELRNYYDLNLTMLAMSGSVVVKVQGDRVVIADKESGAVACLFGTGVDLQEGMELSGTVKGIVAECDGMMCLFPNRHTDVSSIKTERVSSGDIDYESFTTEEVMGSAFDYLYQAITVKAGNVKRLDDGVYIAGNNDEELIYVNDVFGVLADLPSSPVDLVGCISPHPHSKASRMLIPLKAPVGDSDFISIVDMQDCCTEGVYDLQGRLVSRGYVGTGVPGYENQRSAPTGKANSNKAHDGNLAPSHPRTPAPSMKKGVYIVGGRKYVVK